jgi:hypothetical protein
VLATVNPFANDPEKGAVFEQGYFAGFADPTISDFLPLAPELLTAYKSGVSAGKEDRANPPEGNPETAWVEAVEIVAEHSIVHGLGVVIESAFSKVAGGLISLVLTVVTIPGDVMIKPLEADFEGPADKEGDSYVAMCTRSDHPLVEVGVTNDGYWMGPVHAEWIDAAQDLGPHQHPESFVARCSISDATCGPVWAVKKN